MFNQTVELVDWSGRLYSPQTILLARTPAGSTYNVTSVENYTGQVPVILKVKDSKKRLLRPPGVERQISQSMSDLEVPAPDRNRHTSGSVPNLTASRSKKSAAMANMASIATRTASSMANVASALTSHVRGSKKSVDKEQPSPTTSPGDTQNHGDSKSESIV